MAEFPYSSSSGDLPRVLKKVQSDRPPDRLEDRFLQGAGVPKQRWGSVTSALKLLAFIDADGVPTRRWHEYRDPGKAQAVLAEAIREGFAPLYADNPEAHLLGNDDLTSIFAAKVPAARSTGEIITRNFRSLCQLAGLPTPSAQRAKPLQQGTKPQQPKPKRRERKGQAGPLQPESPATSAATVGTDTSITKGNIPIIINIQLSLPETKDASVYDLFFEALKKHLLRS